MAANIDVYLSPADSKKSLIDEQEGQPDSRAIVGSRIGAMANVSSDDLGSPATPVKGGAESSSADPHAVTEESVSQQIAEAVRWVGG